MDKEAAKLWRCFRTVKEMVKDRGYELAEGEDAISLRDFKSKFTSGDGSIQYAPRPKWHPHVLTILPDAV